MLRDQPIHDEWRAHQAGNSQAGWPVEQSYALLKLTALPKKQF